MADSVDKFIFNELNPTPPPFWKQFTRNNLDKLKSLQDNGEATPVDLRTLVPPPLPSDGKYRSFGGNYNIHEALPSLTEQGQEQLFPELPTEATVFNDNKVDSDWTVDRSYHLQKVVRSILLNFLELTGVLSLDATQADNKLNDIENLFVNAYQILNEYRPHQARETLILMMEKQVQERKDQIEIMKTMKARVHELGSVSASQPNGQSHVGNGVSTNGHHVPPMASPSWGDYMDD